MKSNLKGNSAYPKQSGVTLVELLVSLALSLAILIGVSSVYIAAKQSFRFQENAGRLQEDGVFALETLARGLRMAGFAGCRGVDAVTVSGVTTYSPTMSLAAAPTAISGPNPLAAVFAANLAITTQPMMPTNFVRGFDSVPSAMFASGSVPAAGTTDALYFVGGSSNSVSVGAAMGSATSNLTIAADPFGWHTTDAATGSYKVWNMIVSDCNSGTLFAGQLSGTTAITHATSNGENAASFPSSPLYGTDALVMPLEWNLYYVATRSGADTPSLYRVSYDGNNRSNATEIVSNVETMKLNYGENLNGADSATNLPCVISGGGPTCTPNLQADVWRTTAAGVTDWSRVVAIRVGLVMLGADDNTLGDVTANAITLLGQSYTVPTGASVSRQRKEFSTTVVLRNRVSAR